MFLSHARIYVRVEVYAFMRVLNPHAGHHFRTDAHEYAFTIAHIKYFITFNTSYFIFSHAQGTTEAQRSPTGKQSIEIYLYIQCILVIHLSGSFS